MSGWDKKRWPNFSESEFTCKHCGESKIDPALLDKLQNLRNDYGKPMNVSSGYRCPVHNNNVSSTGLYGPHTTGMACDIVVSGKDAYDLLHLALLHGFSGIGIQQKGQHDKRFIHLDIIKGAGRPTIWSYA